jgi:prophage DNA circulation protein
LVQGHEESAGRQGELHVYPFRDDPFFEDLGAAPDQMTVAAFVVGTDYFAARDALRVALRLAGSGELVHPYLGTINVAVTRYSLAETSDEGGVARFSIECVRTLAENIRPDASIATGTVVATRSLGVVTSIVDRLNGALDVTGPGFLATNAASIVEEFAERFDAELAQFGISGQELAELASGVNDLVTNASIWVRTPSALAEGIVGLFDLAAANVPALGRYRSLVRLAAFVTTVAAINSQTESGQRDTANSDAIHGLVRRHALASACEAASEIAYDSYDAAAAERERLADLLETEIDRAADAGHDEEFRTLSDLYAATARDLTARGANLARVQYETLPASVPALALAQRLYADATRADEIVARNRVRHPLFLPGGDPLEVLSA